MRMKYRNTIRRCSGLVAGLTILLLLPVRSLAQFVPAEVIRSQEKTMIGGEVFYIHTVREGQTFFSICKAYGVNQDAVLRANPGLDPENLKIGQAIRIPEASPAELSPYPVNRSDFYEHRIRRRETVYSIARRYKVDIDVIYQYNPWAVDGIKTDQTLWIPRRVKEVPEEPRTGQEDMAYYYTVKQGDTLYAIARQYGVSVADIIENNPVLQNGLQPGQTLVIPGSPLWSAENVLLQDSVAMEFTPCSPVYGDATYNVALLLPFFSETIFRNMNAPEDTLSLNGRALAAQSQPGLPGRTSMDAEFYGSSFVEFYEGFFLALDSLKRTGMNVNLRVWDTERDMDKVSGIQQEVMMMRPDLIIGPVFTENMGQISSLATYQDVNIVSPLSVNPGLIAGNPKLFQVVPSREAESLELSQYLQQYETGQYILVRDSAMLNDSWRFKSQMLSWLPHDSAGFSARFRDFRLNDTLMNNLQSILSKDRENIIIVFSEDEAAAGSLITMLFLLADEYPIRLFGMSSWQVWKSIELEYFHKLQLTVVSPFHTDYSNRNVQDFLKKCRTIYGFEPYDVSSQGYSFCMLGYDIGFYFLSALKTYGRDFQDCIMQVNPDLLLSRYRYLKTAEGGYMNRSVNFIRYNPDFTVEHIHYPPPSLAERP